MKRSGFSMIELVFVIVILGVLAAVAVPRFSTTRVDAQVATLRSDIATTLKAVPARVFAENIEITANGYSQVRNPNGVNYANWGAFILDTAGLDNNRWMVHTTNTGISPIAAKNGNNNTPCNGGPLINITTNNAQFIFSPDKLAAPAGNSGRALCEALKTSYPSGSNRTIPLAATGSVKF